MAAVALEDATEEEMGRHAAALRRLSRASGAASATRGPDHSEGIGGEDAHDVEAAARPDDDPASAERRDDAGEQPSPAS